MYIFQPDRHLLYEQIKSFGHYINGRVLDVGAGEYARYQELFRYQEYLKTDIRMTPNVNIVAEAQNLPFKSDSFDAIVCTQVFEHLKNPFFAASEICRLLKKGGYVLITAPQTNELHEEPHDYFRYTKFGIIEIFHNAGFRLSAYQQRGGFFSLLSQQLIRYAIDKLSLYQRKILGRVFAVPMNSFGQMMIKLDDYDQSVANKKHSIGWTFVFQKSP